MQPPANGTQPADLDASKLVFECASSLKPIPPLEDFVFGAVKTDHMLLVEYAPEHGWGAPRILPYQDLQLDPASHCLHYCTNLFEGMKAYLGPDGEPLLFRPDMNMKRMARSAERLALPSFNPDELLKLIKQLVTVDKRWIPSLPGYSLYIRPTLIGTRPQLGVVASSQHAKLFVILTPTGPFFRSKEPPSSNAASKPAALDIRPVSLLASYDYVRAWPGGTGAYKIGGNYAPCFMPQVQAAKEGYQQILWLLEADDRNEKKETLTMPNGARNGTDTNGFYEKRPEMRITEAGQMNFFCVIERDDGDVDLITPPLDGTVLPGVTRDSILSLARSADPPLATEKRIHAVERNITVEELQRHLTEGRLLEVFGAGTAAVICPIGRIGYRGEDLIMKEWKGGMGPTSKALYDRMHAIFVGEVKGDWSVRCN